MKVPIRVCNIPCIANVTLFNHVKPNYNSWASDMDYHGYTEIEFNLLDRKGYPAPWLEKKAEPIEEDIKQELIEKILEMKEEARYV
jgi:hypothetical protein